MNFKKRLILLGSSLTCLGAGYASYLFMSDEGNRRSVTFQKRSFPIYAHYRLTQYYTDTLMKLDKEERRKQFAQLHRQYADEVLSIILDLRGFYIKIGQLGAQRPDIIPDEQLENLRSLEDRVPPTDFSIVKHIVEKEFGKKLEEIFSDFEQDSIGSASIGQVHKARLRQNGHEVAVKVMHNNVKQLFDSDIKTMRNFVSLAQPEHLPFFDEVKKQFLTEFDYQKEAQNLENISADLKPKYANSVVVPSPYLDLCTKNVLVMEFLKGDKLLSRIKSIWEQLAEKAGISVSELQAQFSQHNTKINRTKASKFKNRIKSSIYFSFLYVRNILWNVLARFINYFASSANFFVKTDFNKSYRLMNYKSTLNPDKLIDLIFDVHGYEMFIKGAFNADPHAGNILLLEDGRLGLIDYGQVKRLNLDQRQKLAQLIIAIDNKQDGQIKNAYINMGFRTRDMNSSVIVDTARLYFDSDTDKVLTGGLTLPEFMERLHEIDPVVEMPDAYVMCGRLAIILRGLANALGKEVSTSKTQRKFAEQILNETVNKSPKI